MLPGESTFAVHQRWAGTGTAGVRAFFGLSWKEFPPFLGDVRNGGRNSPPLRQERDGMVEEFPRPGAQWRSSGEQGWTVEGFPLGRRRERHLSWKEFPPVRWFRRAMVEGFPLQGLILCAFGSSALHTKPGRQRSPSRHQRRLDRAGSCSFAVASQRVSAPPVCLSLLQSLTGF